MRYLFEVQNGDVFVNVVEDRGEIIVQVIDMDTGGYIDLKRFKSMDDARRYAYSFIV
jgi:hypothetical protein